MGKEIIDCRPKKELQIDYSALPPSRMVIVNGVPLSGSAARRAQLAAEEEKKKKKKEAVAAQQQARSSREVLNQLFVPQLGRGSNGRTVDLDEEQREQERLEKIHRVKRQLDEAAKAGASAKRERSALAGSTGNCVFDALVQSAQSSLQTKKSEVLARENAYAEKEKRDRLRILEEKEALLARREEARLQLMSVEVTCFYCNNCRMFLDTPLLREFCESHGHFVERKRDVKRMFECMTCHRRRSFIGTTQPGKACLCGSVLWKMCPLFKEKEVESEKLKITMDNTHVLYSHTIVPKDESFVVCLSNIVDIYQIPCR